MNTERNQIYRPWLEISLCRLQILGYQWMRHKLQLPVTKITNANLDHQSFNLFNQLCHSPAFHFVHHTLENIELCDCSKDHSTALLWHCKYTTKVPILIRDLKRTTNIMAPGELDQIFTNTLQYGATTLEFMGFVSVNTREKPFSQWLFTHS